MSLSQERLDGPLLHGGATGPKEIHHLQLPMDKQDGGLGILGKQVQRRNQKNRVGRYNRVGEDPRDRDAHGQFHRGFESLAVGTAG